jgi:hypothetical protein
MTDISLDQARDIYHILHEKIGAAEYWRSEFMAHVTKNTSPYRIKCSIGHATNFHNDQKGVYVTYFGEYRTQETDDVLVEINSHLKKMGFREAPKKRAVKV